MHLFVRPTAPRHHADLNVISHIPGVLVIVGEVAAFLELGGGKGHFTVTQTRVRVARGVEVAVNFTNVNIRRVLAGRCFTRVFFFRGLK